jgi:integrase/recombinase XerD
LISVKQNRLNKVAKTRAIVKAPKSFYSYLSLLLFSFIASKKMKFNTTPKAKLAQLIIPGFKDDYQAIEQSLLLNGRSESTFKNYSCKLAEISLYYQKTIHKITENEVKNYLAILLTEPKSPSQSSFKHMIYGLRYYYKMIGKDLGIKLPSIPKKSKLPTVLSKDECNRLFNQTKNLKHRLILKFIYSGGFRASEVSNLKWSDIDFDRMMIHIKQSKGKKDRCVPLAENILNELASLYKHGIHSSYLFTGYEPTHKMTRAGIRFIMDQAVKRIGLSKTGVCLHTLRHSYASHLLEDGLDIISIKELLGHSKIETTLVYLHVSHQTRNNKISPLDNLTEKPTPNELIQYKTQLTDILRKKIFSDQLIQSQYQLFETKE